MKRSNCAVLRFVLILVLVAITLLAGAQTTIVVPNGTGTIDIAPRPANQVLYHTVTEPSFIMTPFIRVNGGRIYEQPGHEDTFGSDARVRISRQVNGFGNFTEFRLTTAGGFNGFVDLIPGQKLVAVRNESFVGQLIRTGEVLRMEFFEAFQDGPDREPESVFMNTSFTIGIPLELPTIDADLENIPDSATVTQYFAPGQTRWYEFQLTYEVNDTRSLEITTSDTVGFGESNNTEIALYSAQGYILGIDDDSGPGASAFVSLNYLPEGKYYIAVTGSNGIFNDFFDAVSHSTESGPITLSLRYVFRPPSVVRDFGPLFGDAQHTVYTSGEARWLKFTLPNPVEPGDYFAITTRNTTAFSAGFRGPNDTEIGLYSDTGELIATNDDEDVTAGRLTSLLEFGRRHLSLPAGTYYLAVGGHEMGFLPNWVLDGPFLSPGSGQIEVDLLFTQPFWDVSGTVTLADFTADPQGEPMAWEIRDFLGTTVDSGSCYLGAGGSYQFNTLAFGMGYTVWMKGQTWLGKSIYGVNLMDPATVDLTLINGDVNGDNEIAASDLSILSAAFLATELDPNYERIADLDRDGEVGSSDLAILSQGFLQSGD